ncbi:MAG: polymer-forming cytoskeletal protein [Patescibacteria group bacterium]
MKKVLFALALLLPSSALASTLLFDNNINTKIRSEGNLYVLGETVGLGAPVLGDAYVTGGLVTVSEGVFGDVLLIGETVNIGAPIEGDARFFGRSILLSRPVGGDIFGVGLNIQISSGTTIGKDMFLAGDSISFAGTTNGNIFLRGRDIMIDGSIEGNADIKTTGNITFGPNAKIRGNLSYVALNQGEIPEGVVGGKITKKDSSVLTSLSRENVRSYLGIIAGTFLVLKTLALLIGALLLSVLARNLSKEISSRAYQKTLRGILLGFLILVAFPAGAVLLFVTIIGFYLGLFLLSLLAFLLIVAGMYAGIILGDACYFAWKKEESKSPWLTTIFGTLLLAVISLVPFLGWAFAFVVVLLSLGSISNTLFRKIFP